MRFTSTLALVLASLSLAACGGDDGGGVTPIDARRIDSAGGNIDAPMGACDLPSAGLSLGEAMGIDFDFDDGATPGGAHVIASGLRIGPEMPPMPITVMFIEFYNDYAPFGTSMTPGTINARSITIDATQANYATCGACVRVFTKFVSGMPSTFNQRYMPNGGTITINDITPMVGGAIDVTLTNLTMRQVEIAPMTFETTDVPGGCTSTLADAHITGAIVMPMMKTRPNTTTIAIPLPADLMKLK